jgi:predicted negative regulator of RcsB-dependent stress response
MTAEEDWSFFRMRLTLMAACGRREEAIEMAQAHPEGRTWYAALSIASLQADAGRVEDALATLEQHSESGSVRFKLADYLINLGRIDEAVRVCQLPSGPRGTDAP